MDDDRGEPVTRLGPDSGGRMPGEPGVRVYHWEWGPDDARRPGLPWIGIFLLVFGGLLLIQQAVPAVRGARLGRGPGDRAGVPRQVGGRSRDGLALRRGDHHRARRAGPAQCGRRRCANGLSTFSFGVAFLFIAAVRAVHGRRLGLAALVRRPAGAGRRRQHRRRVVRRLSPADHPRRPRACS